MSITFTADGPMSMLINDKEDFLRFREEVVKSEFERYGSLSTGPNTIKLNYIPFGPELQDDSNAFAHPLDVERLIISEQAVESFLDASKDYVPDPEQRNQLLDAAQHIVRLLRPTTIDVSAAYNEPTADQIEKVCTVVRLVTQISSCENARIISHGPIAISDPFCRLPARVEAHMTLEEFQRQKSIAETHPAWWAFSSRKKYREAPTLFLSPQDDGSTQLWLTSLDAPEDHFEDAFSPTEPPRVIVMSEYTDYSDL
jgi:hypothetical protein